MFLPLFPLRRKEKQKTGKNISLCHSRCVSVFIALAPFSVKFSATYKVFVKVHDSKQTLNIFPRTLQLVALIISIFPFSQSQFQNQILQKNYSEIQRISEELCEDHSCYFSKVVGDFLKFGNEPCETRSSTKLCWSFRELLSNECAGGRQKIDFQISSKAFQRVFDLCDRRRYHRERSGRSLTTNWGRGTYMQIKSLGGMKIS